MQPRGATPIAHGLLAATLLLFGCTGADEFPLPGSDAPANRAATVVAPTPELASANSALEQAEPERVDELVEPAPEPEPPKLLEPAELAQLLSDAEQHLRELGIKTRVRRNARGPLPEGSDLRLAYADARALVLEGRYDQVRNWAALAKFGSAEPGPRCELSPLARYDLLVTRRPREDTAYLHVVVPPHGLAKPGERGKHEAWVGDERWLNLADAIEPEREYLPFKTNGKESLHRQWGRADVIESLVGIAREYRQRTGVPLGIGDLSHVTGGKIEDHWTHQKGVDVDLYLVDPNQVDERGRPQVWRNHFKRGVSRWTSREEGKGQREPALDPDDELSHTPTSRRLEVLASIVFAIDEIAYFVHNDPIVLAPFDEQVGERRPGRRFIHAKNRGYWPTHADHVHLRWVDGELPVGVTPRP